MQISFSELRAKEVVNTQDGKKLGRVCDVALCYPENRWTGIVVPGARGWGLKKNTLFIELRNIVKIGEDVILVNIGFPRKGEKKEPAFPAPPTGNAPMGRNFEELE